jgi:hypothetical protein
MTYMLYEVWAEDEDGHNELLETTASQKEAFEIAQSSLSDGYISSAVYQETDDGDPILIKTFQNDPLDK